VLIALMTAFGLALVLLAVEDRRRSDTALLEQQARESLALAAQVRAELTEVHARMEGLILTGASQEEIREGAPFRMTGRAGPKSAGWAELADDGVNIFALDPDAGWVWGFLPEEEFLPVAETGRTFTLTRLADTQLTARFISMGGDRAVLACSRLGDTGLAACVTRTTPWLTPSDLLRFVIYGLLLTAPTLAVTGLSRALMRAEGASGLSVMPPPGGDVRGLVGSWRYTPARQTIHLSPEAAALLGSERAGDMPLEAFLRLIAEGDQRKFLASIPPAADAATVSCILQGAGAAAGSYVELSGGRDGKAFSGRLVNVTDRILALHRTRRADALARAVLEAHPGPVALWDARRRLTHWNRQFETVFGLDSEVVHAGASHDFVMSEIACRIKAERTGSEEGAAREILLAGDVWISLSERRTAHDGAITIGIDITARRAQDSLQARTDQRLSSLGAELDSERAQTRELTRRLTEEKERADRASRHKSTFLANMSHELRTPLNAINGFSEMLVHEVYGPLGDARYQVYANDILKSGQHLLDMINDILDMAKVEAGRMQITPRLIDCADAVDAAVRLIRRQAEDKQIHLSFEPEEDLPRIVADHRAIKQMTLNLLANAIAFTPAGGEVQVGVVREDDWLVIRVADTGVGISKEDLHRLGQPFEQGRQGGSRPAGAGLGLALTKSFADMHGGHIRLESEEGAGTIASIRLPIPALGDAPRPIAAVRPEPEELDEDSLESSDLF
jgi:two-component system cell cycle sensor histidine kinase PleC